MGACEVALAKRLSKPPSCAFEPRSVLRTRPDRLVEGPMGDVFASIAQAALYWCPKTLAMAPGEGQMGNMRLVQKMLIVCSALP